ncbi:nuclear GTPase SLIP-GC-like [Colossoma macropomum]|uniref:nuclear GTPase SLIP-GC-like n=1 Tax=Colossoma macropomum TaxID=42526 RepID=UPI0018654009|nr:nuclear GTPase SLIP-GC-like [Colossoma macropomum]
MSKRADKRTLEDDNICPPGTTKKQKSHSSSERSDAVIDINRAKEIMTRTDTQLTEQCENLRKLIQYVRTNISELDKGGVKKKTTVGVFGKSGAGKSSLINAILGETDLLPSGTSHACTSVIIQIEANLTDSNYTAEIEFISKEEWKEEFNTLQKILSEDSEESDAVFSTASDKIRALYGENGLPKASEKDGYLPEIPEFLTSTVKTIACQNGTDLKKQIRCYVQHLDSSPGGCYWPVVKSVTIKVPHCKEFLEHIVLVDLPGTGDYNKSRDQMWRSKLRECSTAWIISEINRAGSDKETWELVSNSVADMAQGGECRSICFICTKADDINPKEYMETESLKDEDFQIRPEDSQYSRKKKSECILHRNRKLKEMVKRNFTQKRTIKRHFNCDDDFLSVFTVTSQEFHKEDPILTHEQTEIPLLRDLLKMYNNSHKNEMARQYISGAHGILSLIQGFKATNNDMMEENAKLHENLKKNLQNELKNLKDCCAKISWTLEQCLSQGAAESKNNCVATATKIVKPNIDGRGFHRILSALCENNGFYRTKNGEILDLNTSLIKYMKQHINQAFRDFFPVQGKVTEKQALQASIDAFTIVEKNLITKYESSPVLSHMLKFLQTEEMKLKAMLKQEIVEQKKKMYESLSESITATMLPCYQRAAAIYGKGSMKRKQEILLDHIESSKSEMFQKARTEMLDKLHGTLNYTVKEIETRLTESMKYSLLNARTLPYTDVSKDMKELKRLSTQY